MKHRHDTSIRFLVFGVFAASAVGARGTSAAEPRLEIISVLPTKILYQDGEPGQAKVRLVNPTSQAQQVTLNSTLVWDIEESRTLGPTTVSVPAKGEATATVSWPKVTAKWGHELRVEASVGGKVVDTARQFFSVNTDWMDVIMVVNYWGERLGGEWPFVNYTNLNHWFAWAPADYADNAPKTDEWYTGQVGWKQVKKKIRDGIQRCHALGMHCTFYNNGFTGGSAGVEWARRHPEWIVRDRNGKPNVSGPALAMALPSTDKRQGGKGFAKPAFWDPKCVEWGARNTIESVEMFGWDGLFWDCGGVALFPGYTYDGQPTPHGQDPAQISARNFRLFRETVRKKYPHFGFWYNNAVDHAKQPFWTTFGNGGGLASLAEQLSAPQSAVLVEHRHHERAGSRFNDWRRCYDTYTRERDAMTQRYGGPVIAGYTWGMRFGERDKKSRFYWVASNHLSALYISTQLHVATNPNPSLWPGTQFMTRYSSLLWRRDVKVIAKPERLLTVESTGPVWWKKLVYRRPTPKGEDVIVHLVNVPETQTVDIYRTQAPPSVKATVCLSVPAGRRVRSAWALQMRGYVDDANRGGAPWKVEWQTVDGKRKQNHTSGSACRFGPTQVKLEPKTQGNRVSVDVPAFMFHTLVVFRLAGSGRR